MKHRLSSSEFQQVTENFAQATILLRGALGRGLQVQDTFEHLAKAAWENGELSDHAHAQILEAIEESERFFSEEPNFPQD